MKKNSTLGIIALVTAIAFAACTKNNSDTPVPHKLGSASFIKKDTVTAAHLSLSPITKRDTVTPPIKTINAVSSIQKDTLASLQSTPSAARDTVTPPRKGRKP